MALDVPALSEAVELVGQLVSIVRWFKVGAELFTGAGPDAVAMVRAFGGRVCFDLKYHDIPTTVGRAVAAAARMDVSMLTLHVAGGEKMLRAAVAARGPQAEGRPLLLGVTALTSHDPTDVSPDRIVAAARLAREAGLEGVVASAREAAAIKAACGPEFLVVAPGIRPAAVAGDDQRRTATPREAIAWGADFVVVGRPIIASPSPRQAAREILEEIASVQQPA